MGYMKIDNRLSGGSLIEKDTDWCRHCQAVVDKKTYNIQGGFCSTCHGPLCASCAKRSFELGICEPFKKKIEQQIKTNLKKEMNI